MPDYKIVVNGEIVKVVEAENKTQAELKAIKEDMSYFKETMKACIRDKYLELEVKEIQWN